MRKLVPLKSDGNADRLCTDATNFEAMMESKSWGMAVGCSRSGWSYDVGGVEGEIEADFFDGYACSHSPIMFRV